MSRSTIFLGGERILVFGHDRPFHTLFAALYEDQDAPWPSKAIGYHPAEQRLDPEETTEYGVYPADIHDLDRALIEWGIGPNVRERVGRQLAKHDG